MEPVVDTAYEDLLQLVLDTGVAKADRTREVLEYRHHPAIRGPIAV